MMGYGEQKRGPGRPVSTGISRTERTALGVVRRQEVEWREPADPRRRAGYEADPEAWLRHYLSGTYGRPFERPHREIIDGTMRAHETGGRFVVAAERGIGKSAVLWGMILFLSMSGRQRYPVCVPWAAPALKRAFRFWRAALCFNAQLREDYPEPCRPFAHAKGVAQRVMTTTWRGGPYNGQPTGAQLTIGEGMIVLPDRLGCIGGSTINGNIRGLNHPQDDGTVLRPSIALLDDVQDREVARSPAQVADTVAIIDGDVAACGEPGRDMPMLMACNCIAPGDVSEHYLSHPEWHALRIPCIEAWPAGWDGKDSEARRLWDEWHALFLAGKGDRTHYRRHRKAMVAGMRLSAPAAFKGAEKCPDAFYGVMRMYYRMGHEAFMAERQQAPVDPIAESGPYVLTPAIVMSRRTKRSAWERLPDTTLIVGSTDMNVSYALSTVVLGFGSMQTGGVLWYGVYRSAPLPLSKSMPEAERKKAVFQALVNHGRELSAQPTRPDVWAIDASGDYFVQVCQFAAESTRLCGLQAIACVGRNSKAYKPYGAKVITVREECHMRRCDPPNERLRWLMWNSDHWREVSQRAWLGEVGAPGSMSLPDGDHGVFAMQVSAQALLKKGIGLGGETEWRWKPDNLCGDHDFGDAMAQGYAAAAWGGIGTGGDARREPVKARVVIRRPGRAW